MELMNNKSANKLLDRTANNLSVNFNAGAAGQHSR